MSLPYRPFLYVGIALAIAVSEAAGSVVALSGGAAAFNMAWIWLGIAAPLLLAVAGWLTRRGGRKLVAGWWLLLGADSSALFILAAFLWGWIVAVGHPDARSDYRVVLFYTLAATVVWLAGIVTQDAARLWRLNRAARHVQ